MTLDSKEDLGEKTVGKSVTCLDIMRDKDGLQDSFVSALVLLSLDTTTKSYRRIGFSTMLVKHFDSSQQDVVTIV